MLVNVDGLPGIVDPGVAASDGGDVAAVDHLAGQLTLLGLVLVLYPALAKSHSPFIMTATIKPT